MVLTPEWVLDGTDLVLTTTSAQKSDGKEMKKETLAKFILMYYTNFQRSQMVSYSPALSQESIPFNTPPDSRSGHCPASQDISPQK